MSSEPRFSGALLQALQEAKILGVRAGREHRYTAVWVVVIEGRVFVRSWSDKQTGWYRAFLAEPLGSMQVGQREIAMRAKNTRSQRLREAVSLAYGEKYNTKASQTWVQGFAEPERMSTTLELVPR
ncbi:MAG: nitroreductase/quinone reductase family protein [Longimicrobiales bacterium]